MGDSEAMGTLPDAMTLIDAAIEAHGGEAAFAKARVGQATMEIDGEFQPGLKGHFTKSDIFDLPGKLKRVLDCQIDGVPHQDGGKPTERINYVFNGLEGWMQFGDTEPIKVPMNAEIAQTYPIDNLNALLSLKTGDRVVYVTELTTRNKQPVYCMRTELDETWLGDIFFHCESKLCVAAVKSLNDIRTDKFVFLETRYSDFRDVDGLKLPMSISITSDGRLQMEITVTEVEFLDEVDPTEFAKPVAKEQ